MNFLKPSKKPTSALVLDDRRPDLSPVPKSHHFSLRRKGKPPSARIYFPADDRTVADTTRFVFVFNAGNRWENLTLRWMGCVLWVCFLRVLMTRAEHSVIVQFSLISNGAEFIDSREKLAMLFWKRTRKSITERHTCAVSWPATVSSQRVLCAVARLLWRPPAPFVDDHGISDQVTRFHPFCCVSQAVRLFWSYCWLGRLFRWVP